MNCFPNFQIWEENFILYNSLSREKSEKKLSKLESKYYIMHSKEYFQDYGDLQVMVIWKALQNTLNYSEVWGELDLDFFKGMVICKGSSSGQGGRTYAGDGDLDAAATDAKTKDEANRERERKRVRRLVKKD